MNPNYPGGGGYGGPPGGAPPGGYGPPGGGPPGGYGGPPGGGGYGGPPGGAPPGGYGGPPGGGFGGPPGYGPPGGGFGGPPGYGGMGGGPGGPAPAALSSKVTLWLIMSFVSFFCGCSLLCIVPIIFAFGAKSALDSGDYATAESKIGTAKTLCIVGYCLFAVGVLIQIIAAVAR